MKFKIAFLIISSFLILVSCKEVEQTQQNTQGIEIPTPILLTPEEGLSSIVGKIENVRSIWPEGDIYVYAAEFYGDIDEGKGTYVLETRLFPKTLVDSKGFFQLVNLKPQAFVLVVGPTPEKSKPIQNKNGTDVLIVETIENNIVNLDSVLIEY